MGKSTTMPLNQPSISCTPLSLRFAWPLHRQAVRSTARSAAQVIGRDGTGIMAATLTWLMQAEGAGTGGFFATHPATDNRIKGCRHSQKAMTRGTSWSRPPKRRSPKCLICMD